MTTTTTGSTDTSSYPAPAVSLARMFYDRVAATPRAEAFRFPAETGWASLTWAQTAETVKTMAAGLLALGIQPEERVAIASATRIEWLYADLAIMCAGAATTAVYPSTGGEDVAFIISDSGTRLVFAEDQAQIAKLRAQRDHLPDVIRVVTFDGQADGEWVLSLADLQALGAKHLAGHPAAVDEAVAAVGPEHLATLIYTSGTTGRPKGVELPHRCWTYVGAGAEALGILSAGDLQYLWLPLSHAFGKMLEAVQLQIGFPTAVDGRMDKIVENLAVVRPTFMAGPPRIFEKIHAKVVQTAQEEGGIKFKVFTWAFGVGNQVSRARIQGRKPGLAVQAQHALADRLVLSKVRQALGGRIRFLLSGSAALSKDIATWFHAAGLLVLEGYALTETSAAACMVLPQGPGVRGYGPAAGRHRDQDRGRWGDPHPGSRGDARVSPPARGHRRSALRRRLVRHRGPRRDRPGRPGADHRPQERPGQDLRRQVHCPAGHRGDVQGDLPAGQPGAGARGPAQLRDRADHPGPRRAGPVGTGAGPDRHQLRRADREPAVRRYVQSSIEELNGRLNRWETVKDFRILDRDLTVEEGELTPSMKIKRKVVETKYASLLDSMYGGRSRG